MKSMTHAKSAAHPEGTPTSVSRSFRKLGFDHERLTFRFQGRDFRLTDVHGKVVREVLA
jgi:hypothetical protein